MLKKLEISEDYDGYINEIHIGGKRYKLRCDVVTVNPIVCPKCGSSFELKYGSGRCEYCGTYFTTKFEIVEKDC